MNNFWYRATIFGLLLMFVCAPFAGFAPLLLIILLGGVYWFLVPILRAFFSVPKVSGDRDRSNAITTSPSKSAQK